MVLSQDASCPFDVGLNFNVHTHMTLGERGQELVVQFEVHGDDSATLTVS